MSASKLYDAVVLDHIRNARNFHPLEDADLRAEAVNPLCGDSFTVYVRMDGERLGEVAFQCECCGISMASASIMTEWLRGRTRDEALRIKRSFFEVLKDPARDEVPEGPADHRAVVQIVRNAPQREGCAQLAWTALEKALSGEGA